MPRPPSSSGSTRGESGPKGLLATAPEGARPGEYRVLVGRALAQSLGVTPGSELAVVGQGKAGSIANDLYTVAGVLPSAIDLVNRQGVLMSLEDAQQLFVMPDEASEIILHAARPEAARELAGGVAARPAFAGLEVLPWQDVVPELVAILELADVSSYIVLIFVFVAAAAGVANTMMMATFERLHEFGMLLALGATPGRIMRLIVAEAALLGLLVALGTLLAPVSWRRRRERPQPGGAGEKPPPRRPGRAWRSRSTSSEARGDGCPGGCGRRRRHLAPWRRCSRHGTRRDWSRWMAMRA